jgi:hypothetical protein
MYKYITMNGDVYVKTDRLTTRRVVELIAAMGIAKCRHLYISAYNLCRWIGGL